MKQDYAGLKTSSVGQLLEQLCVYSRRHIIESIFINLCQDVYFHVGHVGLKIRSVGQIFEKPCKHSRMHSFDPVLIKLCQSICLYKILARIETWLCRIRK